MHPHAQRGKRVMVTAILLGVVVGAVSFVPYVGLRKAKHATRTSNFGHMTILLLALLVSIVILFGATLVCIFTARDVILPFTLAEVITLAVVAIAFGVWRIVRK